MDIALRKETPLRKLFREVEDPMTRRRGSQEPQRHGLLAVVGVNA